MGLYDLSVYDVICRNARIFADRPAWYEVDDGRALTFGEFRRQVDHLACGLGQAGLAKGDRMIQRVDRLMAELAELVGEGRVIEACGVAAVAEWRARALEVHY